ncbi:MAG: DUF1045 domain-containing protein [Paracoccus sp. (in: a-proteobacteria)]
MEQYRRYAIYYTPPAGPFADFGASWLGWDLDRGRAIVPSMPDLGPFLRKAASYGFHATLKAPFRLADGVGVRDLLEAASRLVADLAAPPLPMLRLDRVGGCFALIPGGDTAELDAFSGTIVRQLDPLRAPLIEAELVRRNPSRLSPRQRQLLMQWGYPYVCDEFRFHMTLSDPLDDDMTQIVSARILDLLDGVAMPARADAISLVGEGADGSFRLISRLALKSG